MLPSTPSSKTYERGQPPAPRAPAPTSWYCWATALVLSPSQQDIYDTAKRSATATDLATMLFPVPLWGFETPHPASISVDILEQSVEKCRTSWHQGRGRRPVRGRLSPVWKRFVGRIVVSMPIIREHAISLAPWCPLQVIAPRNTEFTAPQPHHAVDSRRGETRQRPHLSGRSLPHGQKSPTKAFRPHPRRPTSFHRMAWKYQAFG